MKRTGGKKHITSGGYIYFKWKSRTKGKYKFRRLLCTLSLAKKKTSIVEGWMTLQMFDKNKSDNFDGSTQIDIKILLSLWFPLGEKGGLHFTGKSNVKPNYSNCHSTRTFRKKWMASQVSISRRDGHWPAVVNVIIITYHFFSPQHWASVLLFQRNIDSYQVPYPGNKPLEQACWTE